MSTESTEKTDPLVIFMPTGRRSRVPPGQSLLVAARQMGVEIESICGGRMTCGKCKVRIEEGSYPKHGITSSAANLSPPKEKETLLLRNLGSKDHRLSCSTYTHGDVLVYVPEESRAQKQIIRKSATERSIQVYPAVRKLYVEVDKAILGEHRGDWGRLVAALSDQWGLENLTIDLTALRRLQLALRTGKWSVTVTLWNDEEVIDVRPGYTEGVYGLAVDIGSTTVAGYLCDLRTGELLATESTMNPQVAFGEDLMSRVSFATNNPDGLQKMHQAIIKTLNQLAAHTTKQANLRAREIHDCVLVGNTTMIHIVLGIDPIELGNAPFALANRDAIDLKARELGLKFHPGGYVHILPSEAGHVGADNVAVLIAEEPYRREDITLVADIGTNAEIVLGNRDWMYSASSPTGPAFEGAQITFGMRAALGAIERVRIDPQTKVARFRVIGEEKWSNEWQSGLEAPLEDQPHHLASGICGSGIIEAVVEMYLAGIIQPDGRIDPDLQSERVVWDGPTGAYVLATGDQTTSGEPIVVTQADVRSIQLAKAALYAGAKLLMKKAGVKKMNRILLAGAFGSYIDPQYAMILGLIPDCDLNQVYAIGNAAGDGARIALINHKKRIEAQEIAHWVKYIETAVDPDFQEEFVKAMHIPHSTDSFPHLKGFLPDNRGSFNKSHHRKRMRYRQR